MSVPDIKEILLLHHSHLDVGYTHSQPILWELQQEYIYQVLDWLEKTEDMPDGARPKWTCEATEPVRQWLGQALSGDVARFIKHCSSGRLGLSALRWHTTALANRAGLERLLDGKGELEAMTGSRISTACQHDVNGIPWPLADVLLDRGVDFFVMGINSHLGRAVRPRPGMFLWEAPSGRTLRVWNGNHYTMFDQLLNAWDDSVSRMAESWNAYARHLGDLGYPFDFFYLTSTCAPVMWDNAPNNPFLPSLIRRWNEAGCGPRIRYATFDDLRARAAAVPDSQLPVLRGDWTDYWAFGGGSSPISTSRNQQAKSLIEAAEGIFDALDARQVSLLRRAKEKVDLYDEHTYGYYDSDHAHPQAQTTEILKQAVAHEGHELAAFAAMNALERLAQNPPADRGLKGVLLCNPGPYPIVVRPELPASWFSAAAKTERTYRASRLFYDGRSWGRNFPGAAARSFGPVELPPHSWKTLPFEDLPPAETSPAVRHEIMVLATERREANFAPVAHFERRVGLIESPFHELRYDPDSGHILSLLDRQSRHQAVAPRSDGTDFFAFVRERTNALVEDRRYAFYQRDLEKEKMDASCWQDWSPVREPATRVLRCTVAESCGRIVLTRELQAPGMIHAVQRITLSGHDPVIALEVEMELVPNPSPQAIYFAFPLRMKEGWQAAYDTAGALVRVDEEQLPGACRNWVTSEMLAAMWDDQSGVGLFAPDVPTVQFGDFHFGSPLERLPRPANPLLLAWPVNNYWDTNTPRVQSGRIRLRYGFVTFGEIDLTSLRRQAEIFRQPVMAWPVTFGGRGRDEGCFR
jgi:alpha-mannosidase